MVHQACRAVLRSLPRSAKSLPRVHSASGRRRTACHAATPPSPTGDENKAVQFQDRNRRKPAAKDGSSSSSNLISAMSELQKGQPKPQGTKTVFGADQMSWKEVDEAVNEYPCQRVFTAIGEGSVEFKMSMVQCVEEGLGTTVKAEHIQVRPSKAGKYFSVRIGPMMVAHAGEVMDVYGLMKKDTRMKWFI